MVAIFHRSGQHNNMYELTESQKATMNQDIEILGENIAGPSGSRVKTEGGVKSEFGDARMEEDEEEEGDEEEDEFEEVAA